MARHIGALAAAAAALLAAPGFAQPPAVVQAKSAEITAPAGQSTCEAAVDPALVARWAAVVRQAMFGLGSSAAQPALEAAVTNVILESGADPWTVDMTLRRVLASEITDMQRAAVEEVHERVGAVMPPCTGPTADLGPGGSAPIPPPPGGGGGGGTDYPPPP